MREKPVSLLLIHGAGSGPWVFERWHDAFPTIQVAAMDLHAGREVANASMSDFADAVVRAAGDLPQPVVLCGWSMGGLVALEAAQHVRPHSLVLLEPSPPAETQGFDPGVELAAGVFDPEDVYAPFPPGMRARRESLLARAERKRGICVPSLGCPVLVVVGDEFRHERGRPIADLYGGDLVDLPDLGHWDLVLDDQVRDAVRRWLADLSYGRRRSL